MSQTNSKKPPPKSDAKGKTPDVDAHQASGPRNTNDGEYGEGNYKASKQYNDATRDFAQSGKVPGAAKNARPHSPAEAEEMTAAEAEGRSHSKGEDAHAMPRPGSPKRAT